MAQVKLKLYKGGSGIQTFYQVSPEYNVSRELTPVSGVEEQTALAWLQNKAQTASNASEYQAQLNQYYGANPYVLNQQGILATQKEVAAKKAQQQAIASGSVTNWGTAQAPLTVPLGTPTPQQSNIAFQATQPKPIYGETINKDYAPIQFPNQNKTDYSNEIAQLQAMTEQLTKTRDTAKTEETSNFEDILKKYLGESISPPKQGEDYATALGTTSAEMISNEKEAQKRVNDLNAQLNNITTSARVAIQTLESQAGGRDMTGAFLGRKQQEINRQAVIQGLPIAAQLEVAQGNLELASKHIDKLFNLQMQDETNLYNYKKDLRDTVFAYATEKEKRLLALQDKEDTQNLSIYNATVNDIRQMAQTAISNGDANTASQITQLVSSLNPNSKTFQADIARVNNEMAVLQRQIKPKAPTPVPTTLTSDIENYALNLNAGQVKIANVPQAIRGQVLAKAKDFAVEDMKEDIITGISQNAFKDKNNAISQLRNVYPEFTKEEIEKEVNSLFESTITPIKESQGGVAKAVGGFFGGVAKAVGGFFNRLFGK